VVALKGILSSYPPLVPLGIGYQSGLLVNKEEFPTQRRISNGELSNVVKGLHERVRARNFGSGPFLLCELERFEQ
jgi:hypothetical protein